MGERLLIFPCPEARKRASQGSDVTSAKQTWTLFILTPGRFLPPFSLSSFLICTSRAARCALGVGVDAAVGAKL
jgi:hypothetical protein